MNLRRGKTTMVAAIVVAAFAGLTWAHRRFDRRPAVPVPSRHAEAKVDLSDLWLRLMDGGVRLRDEVRADLFRRVPNDIASRLADFLPDPEASWRQGMNELRSADPARRPPAPDTPVILEPWVRVVPGRPPVLVDRKLPGRIRVEILRAGTGDPMATFDVAVRRRTPLPEGFQLEAGGHYVVVLRTAPDIGGGAVELDRRSIEVLSREDVARLRDRFTLAKRYIRDPAARSYAQVILAMGAGLHGEAAELMMSRASSRPNLRRGLGFDGRDLFLADLFRSYSRRAAALRRLRR